MPLRGQTVDQLLSLGHLEPVDLAAFDVLVAHTTPAELQQLVDWIQPQFLCSAMIRHHGLKGLSRILTGIARACARHKVHMSERVGNVAAALDLPVY